MVYDGITQEPNFFILLTQSSYIYHILQLFFTSAGFGKFIACLPVHKQFRISFSINQRIFPIDRESFISLFIWISIGITIFIPFTPRSI